MPTTSAARPMTADAMRKLAGSPDAFDDRFIAVDDAAKALGINAGNFRRKCNLELAGREMAYYGSHPIDGGNPRWWVHRGYDPRLSVVADGGAAEASRGGVEGATLKQIQIAEAKRRCVDALLAIADGQVNAKLPEEIQRLDREIAAPLRNRFNCKFRVSRSSVYRWAKQLAAGGLGELTDARGGDRASAGDPAFWQFVRAMYNHGNRIKKKVVYDNAVADAKKRGYAYPASYNIFRRRLRDHCPDLIAQATRDPRRYRNQTESRARLHKDTFAANERWDGDHMQSDVWVSLPDRDRPVRPFVTLFMDWRSRAVPGWHVSITPNHRTIASALRMGVEDPQLLGPPAKSWLDNGKDFKAVQLVGGKLVKRKVLSKGYIDETFFGGVYRRLGIEPHFALPHNPTGKSRVEVWFGHWVHERFEKVAFPNGYCGNNTLNRPEHVMAARKKGLLPTWEEYIDGLAAFIAGYNLQVEREVDDLVDDRNVRLCPLEYLQRFGTHRHLSNPEALKYLFLLSGEPRSVTSQGIGIKIAGKLFEWGRGAVCLDPFRGNRDNKLILAYDPANVRLAWAFELNGRFVGEVAWNGPGGAYGDPVSVEHLTDAQRDRANMNRRIRDAVKFAALDQVETVEQQAARKATRRTRPAAEGGHEIVRTPLDGQMKRLRTAQRRRLAAGAESEQFMGGGDDIESLGLISGDSSITTLNTPSPADGDDIESLDLLSGNNLRLVDDDQGDGTDASILEQLE